MTLIYFPFSRRDFAALRSMLVSNDRRETAPKTRSNRPCRRENPEEAETDTSLPISVPSSPAFESCLRADEVDEVVVAVVVVEGTMAMQRVDEVAMATRREMKDLDGILC